MYIRAQNGSSLEGEGCLVTTGSGFDVLEPDIPAARPWQDVMKANYAQNIPITLETPMETRK